MSQPEGIASERSGKEVIKVDRQKGGLGVEESGHVPLKSLKSCRKAGAPFSAQNTMPARQL